MTKKIDFDHKLYWATKEILRRTTNTLLKEEDIEVVIQLGDKIELDIDQIEWAMQGAKRWLIIHPKTKDY